MKKIIIGMLTLLIMATFSGAFSGVFADSSANINAVEMVTDQDVFNSDATMSDDQLREAGLTEEEIYEFNHYEGHKVYVKNGAVVTLDENGNVNKQVRGKLTWAIRIINKVYNKLPYQAKSYIGQYMGWQWFMSKVEHYTGWIENALYDICRWAGMPTWMANFVAKTIMLVAF